MGNRAVITFDKNRNKKSVGIYLHWNGGPESIIAFAEAARHFKVCTPSGDPTYCVARFAQIIANYFGGTCSIGIGTLDSLDTDNGDNGVFLVDWNDERVTVENSEDGEKAWQIVDVEGIKANDGYWVKSKGRKTSILEDVIAANEANFKDDR